MESTITDGARASVLHPMVIVNKISVCSQGEQVYPHKSSTTSFFVVFLNTTESTVIAKNAKKKTKKLRISVTL